MYIFSHKRSINLRIVIFALVAMLLLPSFAMATPEEDSSDIDALRARATQARIRLDQLSVEMQTASENYFEAQELLEATIAEIEELEIRLDINQEQLDQVSELLSERAVSAYQGEQLTFISFLFESDSFSDLIVRINMLRAIMDNDANMIREARMLRAEIESKRTRLEEKRELEEETAEREQRELESVQRLLGQQQNLLASLDDEVYRLIEEERTALAEEQLRLAQQQAADEERGSQAQTEEPSSVAQDDQDDDADDSNDSQIADSSNDDSNASVNDPTNDDVSSSSAAENDTADGSNASSNASNNNNNAGSAGSSNASNSNSGNNTSSNNNTSGGGSNSSAGQGNNNSSSNNANSGGSNSSSNQGSGSAAPALGQERPGVIPVARRFVGVTPYLWGGTTPAGFDCSGLVQYVFREAYGINLPRTSRQQFHAGVFIPLNQRHLMRPGDLVFFSSTGRPENIHHVGIYIGNNRIIHAPSSGRFVSEQTLWLHDFIGAVRP